MQNVEYNVLNKNMTGSIQYMEKRHLKIHFYGLYETVQLL